MTRLATAISLLFVLLIPSLVLAVDPRKGLASEFDGLSVFLKPTEGMNRRVRVHVKATECSYIHGASNLFPNRQPEPVTIKRVRWHGDTAEVRFESLRLGTGEIKFFVNGDPEALKSLFDHAFSAAEKAPGVSSLVGNTSSQMLHLSTCNHLPSESERVEFNSPHLGIQAGYRECPLCFAELPGVRDYLVERQLGLQVAAQTRAFYPPVMDEEKQGRLRTMGEKVLGRWPSTLKGYAYSFMLVDSDLPNAFAAPGGKIFVTSALIADIEDDSELEAVLAHEIAHVEKRHGYRQYVSAQKAAAWAAVAAAAGAVLASRGSSSATGAVTATILLSQLASALILSGHAREYEEEADAYAAMYFDAQGEAMRRQGLVQVLKKLKYSDELSGHFEQTKGAFASHPGIDDRIDVATNSLVGRFAKGAIFQGVSEDGNLVATLHLELQRSSKNTAVSAAPSGGFVASGERPPPPKTEKYSILSTLYTTAELGKPCEVKKLKIISADTKLTLENSEKTEARPLEVVSMLFEASTLERKLLEEVISIDLDIPNVKTWSKSESAN